MAVCCAVAQRVRKGASARRTKPKLTACIAQWRREWEGELASKMTASLEDRLQQELVAVKKDLKEANKLLEEARAQGFDAAASAAEVQRR